MADHSPTFEQAEEQLRTNLETLREFMTVEDSDDEGRVDEGLEGWEIDSSEIYPLNQDGQLAHVGIITEFSENGNVSIAQNCHTMLTTRIEGATLDDVGRAVYINEDGEFTVQRPSQEGSISDWLAYRQRQQESHFGIGLGGSGLGDGSWDVPEEYPTGWGVSEEEIKLAQICLEVDENPGPPSIEQIESYPYQFGPIVEYIDSLEAERSQLKRRIQHLGHRLLEARDREGQSHRLLP